MENTYKKTALVALGGNSIIRQGEEGNINQQIANTRRTLPGLMKLIKEDYRLVITHGSGTQVGDLFLMVDSSRDFLPELPLDVCVADTQAQIGYIIQQSLRNSLIREDIPRKVATLITQVVVDEQDPYLRKPKKPIGPFYAAEKAERIRETFTSWKIVGDSERGYRIVVPSPVPLRIVGHNTIQSLLAKGVIVIAAGGGGIPVISGDDGAYEGLDVMVEKDLTAGVLAQEVQAEFFVIITAVDKVTINFNTPDEHVFDELHVEEALTYLGQGHFPPNTMGPKIRAAISFLQHGGKEVLITSVNKFETALEGKDGTRIVR